jgi:hypothetical protein
VFALRDAATVDIRETKGTRAIGVTWHDGLDLCGQYIGDGAAIGEKAETAIQDFYTIGAWWRRRGAPLMGGSVYADSCRFTEEVPECPRSTRVRWGLCAVPDFRRTPLWDQDRLAYGARARWRAVLVLSRFHDGISIACGAADGLELIPSHLPAGRFVPGL